MWSMKIDFAMRLNKLADNTKVIDCREKNADQAVAQHEQCLPATSPHFRAENAGRGSLLRATGRLRFQQLLCSVAIVLRTPTLP